MIYTRNATCAPIRAEEGISGILTPPNSSTSFRDLPENEQIGGYPTVEQLSQSQIDATTLDAEGRCVILEFPAFVLIGTYCPAERDATRSDYRTGFLTVLDARIRNLVSLGKRVVWTGDLNISREQIDSAAAEENMRKHGLDTDEWISTPARRILNQLLVEGKVCGERDEGREHPILWDICRGFHKGRKGMYTCWETKINARPGNYGSRIDYVICSTSMRDWFSDSNIQEGLMGSDHCPVYAVIKDKVSINGREIYITDIMNPPGMVQNGIRKQEWSSRNLLPLSGKMIPEFDRRRNIREMFVRKPSLTTTSTSDLEDMTANAQNADTPSTPLSQATDQNIATVGIRVPPARLDTGTDTLSESTTGPGKVKTAKRTQKPDASTPAAKRAKPGSQNNATGANGPGKGQQSLKGFFKTKPLPITELNESQSTTTETQLSRDGVESKYDEAVDTPTNDSQSTIPPVLAEAEGSIEDEFASVATRSSWSKMFSKPIAPRCEHGEPCKTMITKKPGINCGRWFWMCNRPLGPSGQKERNTQWRCSTFIWTSDWDGHAGGPT